MKAAQRNRLLSLGALGAAVLIGGLYVRHRITASPAYRLRRAMADPRYKQMDAAVARLQAAVAASPQDPKAHWALAAMYQRLGLFGLAADELDRVVALTPDDVLAAVGLANTRLATNQLDKAQAAYQNVTVRWPKRADGWEGLGAAYYQQGRASDAVAAVRQALKLNPHDNNARYMLGASLLMYAQQFPDSDDFGMFLAAARVEMQKLPHDFPAPGEADAKLGAICQGLRDYKTAIKHLELAAQKMPNRPDVALQLIQSYAGSGDRAEARKLTEQAVVRFPKHAVFHDLLGQYIQASTDADAPQKAYEQFRRAAELAPGNAFYLGRYGSACARLNKLPEARDALIRAVQANPDQAYPYQQLASVYARLGEMDLSNAAAKQATQMVFNDQQLKRLQQLSTAHPEMMALHLQLADRYRDLHLWGAAREQYLVVTRYDPHFKRAVDGLAAVNQAANSVQTASR